MAKILEVEHAEKKEAVILVCGNKNPLISLLLQSFAENLKVVYIGDKSRIPFENSNENLYHIENNPIENLQNLEEKIDYAVVFLESTEDKEKTYQIFQKLDRDKTRTAVIIDIRKASNFFDICLDIKKKENYFVLYLGDLFGNRVDPEFSLTSNLLNRIKTKGEIELTGNDLEPVFPIYQDNADELGKIFVLIYND